VPSKIVTGVPFETPLEIPQPPFVERRKHPRSADHGRRVFDIQVADGGGVRSDASILIDRMYATRGYLSSGLPRCADDDRITLVASEAERTIGTITMGFDARDGLMVDDLFGDEVDALRERGLRLSEFTKLAIDNAVRSRRVLASLFHAAYIYALPIKGADRLLIEVNPRHVGYYRRMLGFQALSEARVNRRVDAPAVLMMLDLSHARAQIAALGGLQCRAAPEERSLYPWFFSRAEEQQIVARARGHRVVYTRAPRGGAVGRPDAQWPRSSALLPRITQGHDAVPREFVFV
jgi:hypothetical protein